MGSRADLPDLSQGGAPLEICLLGELEVRRAGKAVALPASRKTRALLGYLVATGKAQPRNHLCDLFWADSDDPRAALRWSLNKLRPIVDEATAARLRSEGDRVAFAPQGALVDLTALQQRIGADCSRVPTEALASTITYFRGEFLEGLDLPGCYHYHAWCMAERARLRTLRTSMLAILVERFSARPETALRYARERFAVDPFDEQAHIALIRLLETSAASERRSRSTRTAGASSSVNSARCLPPRWSARELRSALIAPLRNRLLPPRFRRWRPPATKRGGSSDDAASAPGSTS
jgi:DNA-binding SARP family transcriptional activator